jgi:probable HAF family extracellular repeat protein
MEENMNSQKWTRIIALMLFAALAIPIQLAAQTKENHPHQYHHYHLTDSGTFGGPSSSLFAPGIPTAGVLDKQGALVGGADTTTLDPYCFFNTDCYVNHAYQMLNGVTTDLGVLGAGPGSEADWISANGLIAGTSENGEINPLSGIPELHSVLWDHGVITDVGVLPEGGYESYSGAVNSRGQVVGIAANTIPDPNSIFAIWGYQSRAFLWDRQSGMQDLGPLPGGSDAAAALINERGQVAGWSYTSSDPSAFCASYGFALTTGSFIWDKKNGMRDLGGLGGTCTLVIALNNRGQIVGESNLAGDQVTRGFVWEAASGLTELETLGGSYGYAEAINDRGEAVGGSSLHGTDARPIDAVMWRKISGKWQKTDLGRVAGSNCAWGFSINASRQVVGNSGADCNGVAFLWEPGGPVVDLNTLVFPPSTLNVVEGININDRGEIAAVGHDDAGNDHSLLLIPCDENHPGIEGCDYSSVDAAEVTTSVSKPFSFDERGADGPGMNLQKSAARLCIPRGAPCSVNPQCCSRKCIHRSGQQPECR